MTPPVSFVALSCTQGLVGGMDAWSNNESETPAREKRGTKRSREPSSPKAKGQDSIPAPAAGQGGSKGVQNGDALHRVIGSRIQVFPVGFVGDDAWGLEKYGEGFKDVVVGASIVELPDAKRKICPTRFKIQLDDNGEQYFASAAKLDRWQAKADKNATATKQEGGAKRFKKAGKSSTNKPVVKTTKLADADADTILLAEQNFVSGMKHFKGHKKNRVPKAIKLWRLAADHGHLAAQHRLGQCYFDGTFFQESLPINQ